MNRNPFGVPASSP